METIIWGQKVDAQFRLEVLETAMQRLRSLQA